MAISDVEFRRRYPESEPPLSLSMLDIINNIDTTRNIFPEPIYEDEEINKDLARRSDLSAAQHNIDRVARNVFEVTKKLIDGVETEMEDEYYPILDSLHIKNDLSDDKKRMFTVAKLVIHQEIEKSLTEKRLLSQAYDGPEERREDDTGRVTEIIQYRKTQLAPTRNSDGQIRYEWMMRATTLPNHPDQLVLKRVVPWANRPVVAVNGSRA